MCVRVIARQSGDIFEACTVSMHTSDNMDNLVGRRDRPGKHSLTPTPAGQLAR